MVEKQTPRNSQPFLCQAEWVPVAQRALQKNTGGAGCWPCKCKAEVDRSLRVCGPSIDLVHVCLFQQRTQAQTYGWPPWPSTDAGDTSSSPWALSPSPGTDVGSELSACLWYIPALSLCSGLCVSHGRHQSVFTDVTSLSANQSQSQNPQPQKSAAGLPCVAITAEDLLRVLLPLESPWNIPPSSTRMASPAPLPISSKSPLMLRAQLGFSRPSWCHGAERSPLASGHFFFFSLCFPLGITVKSSLGPCTAYPEA